MPTDIAQLERALREQLLALLERGEAKIGSSDSLATLASFFLAERNDETLGLSVLRNISTGRDFGQSPLPNRPAIVSMLIEASAVLEGYDKLDSDTEAPVSEMDADCAMGETELASAQQVEQADAISIGEPLPGEWPCLVEEIARRRSSGVPPLDVCRSTLYAWCSGDLAAFDGLLAESGRRCLVLLPSPACATSHLAQGAWRLRVAAADRLRRAVTMPGVAAILRHAELDRPAWIRVLPATVRATCNPATYDVATGALRP